MTPWHGSPPSKGSRSIYDATMYCFSAALIAVAMWSGCDSGGATSDPCSGIDCGEHGECVEQDGRASCLCVAGYIEYDMECIKDPCSSSPCVHGTCKPDGKNALCDCEPGYSGALCDHCASGYRADGLECVPGSPCADDPCVYGVCRNIGGLPECECFTGYAGDLCDECAPGFHPKDLKCVSDTPCEPDPCVHGECIDDGGRASCKCNTGYAGTYCDVCDQGYHEEDLKCVPDVAGPCDPNPCTEVHRTVCREDGSGGHLCECDPGYHDESGACVEDTTCDPGTTCSGKGTCTGNGLECECYRGYSGEHCETCDTGYHRQGDQCVKDTPCEPNPCKVVHKTRCEVNGRDFVCLCDDGYQDEDSDGTCKPDCTTAGLDCGDHGECGIVLGSAKCVCDPGYEGNTCTSCAAGYQDNDGDGTCRPDCGHSGLDCGGASCDDSSGTAVCSGVRSCKTIIEYVPQGDAPTSLYIRGEFNDWSLSDPMEKQDDGTFVAKLELPPGNYAYKLYDQGNDRWFEDPGNPYFKWVGGQRNSRLNVDDCTFPVLKLLAKPLVAGGDVSFDVQYIDGSKAAGLDRSKTVVTRDGELLEVNFAPSSVVMTISDRNLPSGKHVYRVRAYDKAGRPTRLLYVPVWIENQEFHWKDAVMYFVLTDRFKDGDPSNNDPTPGVDQKANWHGGDFKGLLDVIESGYFESLGVNTLWVSSVTQNTSGSGLGSDGHLYSGYHSYWPIATGWRDDNQLPGVQPVDPHFGDLDLFKRVVREAHGRGIRVLVDFVANHVHQDSPLWAEHKDDDPPWFHDLYVCGWDQPINCWFAPYLPDFDYKNLDVLNTVVEHAIWLVQETGIDGFRLDAVKHMIHDFSYALRARIQESVVTTGIRFYMVGETFTGEDGAGLIKDYVRPEELDGQFDFPLYWQVVKTFLREEQDFRGLESMLQWDLGYYGDWAVMSNFLGNHDVARALSHAAGQIADMWGNGSKEQGWNDPPGLPSGDQAFKRLKAAWTFLMTIPGIPLIYYGDEFGMPGAGDPDNRRDMLFGGDLDPRQLDTLEHVRKLGTARRDHPALRYGVRKQLYMSSDGLAWAYGAEYMDDVAVTVFNRRDIESSLDVPVAGLGLSDGTKLKDVVSGNLVTVASGKIVVHLGPRETALLVEE